MFFNRKATDKHGRVKYLGEAIQTFDHAGIKFITLYDSLCSASLCAYYRSKFVSVFISRDPCSEPVINDSGHQKQSDESTTMRNVPCLLESSLQQPRPLAPSQWASNLRPSPNCGLVIETLQSGPGRPSNKQRTEPHMGPPMQLMGSYRPSNEPEPLPGIGPPEPGIGSPGPGMEPSGPNMDSLEMDGSDRRSLGMSPQSQVLVRM